MCVCAPCNPLVRTQRAPQRWVKTQPRFNKLHEVAIGCDLPPASGTSDSEGAARSWDVYALSYGAKPRFLVLVVGGLGSRVCVKIGIWTL